MTAHISQSQKKIYIREEEVLVGQEILRQERGVVEQPRADASGESLLQGGDDHRGQEVAGEAPRARRLPSARAHRTARSKIRIVCKRWYGTLFCLFTRLCAQCVKYTCGAAVFGPEAAISTFRAPSQEVVHIPCVGA